MTDAKAAAKAIESAANAEDPRTLVTLAAGIADDVMAALRAAHPRRFIITQRIVKPGHAADAPMPPGDDDRYDDAAIERARDRIAALRGRQ